MNFNKSDIKTKAEYAKLVPLHTEQEYEDLKSSIRQDGFWRTHPIVVNAAGFILDGHHRVKISNELDIEPVYEIMEFGNVLQEKLFVINSNLTRRQLTTFQRIELSLAKKPILQEIAKYNMSKGGKGDRNLTPLGRIDEKIAISAGTSRDTVRKVEILLQEADQDDLKKARAGKRSINQVYAHVQKNRIRRQLEEEASKVPFQSNVNLKNVRLYHGDFTTIVPKVIAKNSVDFIFTDPPWANQYLHLYKDLAIQAAQVLRPQKYLITYVTHANIPQIIRYFEEEGLSYCSIFCAKHSGNHEIDHQKNVMLEMTPLLWFVKGDSKKAKGLNQLSNYIDSEKVDKIPHEWQQSLVEAHYYIDKFTVEGEIVLDPFMGSGTTLEAAYKLGRKSIGIEIDKGHYSNAAQRLARLLLRQE